ncbi:calpain-type cysteine protease DEK1-like [Zingiber officinale]|uniref:calpain-type cysteine protease DEK1-like n=1 Tax=Zingiber officinale TaxID=94328 RepID=UPI001C4B3D38|nr:calpain-type cysteine protease DEK1-like [Zingiber officinale]
MQTRNALASTYSAPQRSASSGALLIGDPSVMRDRAGNFVLPQAIVMKLRDRLRNEEVAADLFLCGTKNGLTYCRIEAGQVGLRLVSKGDRLTTIASEWSIGFACITIAKDEYVHPQHPHQFISESTRKNSTCFTYAWKVAYCDSYFRC